MMTTFSNRVYTCQARPEYITRRNLLSIKSRLFSSLIYMVFLRVFDKAAAGFRGQMVINQPNPD